MVLSCQMHDSSFSDTFLADNQSLQLISKFAAECDPSLRLSVLEKHCQQLRKLFKDFIKPSHHSKKTTKWSKRIVLDGSRAFPPVRGCVFTEGHTCVLYKADPAAGFGLPRGTFLYATSPLARKVGKTVTNSLCQDSPAKFYFLSILKGTIILLGGGALFSGGSRRSGTRTLYFRGVCSLHRPPSKRLDQSSWDVSSAQVSNFFAFEFVLFLFFERQPQKILFN